MYCYKCGKRIPDDSAFCPFCGTRQHRDNESSGADQPGLSKPGTSGQMKSTFRYGQQGEGIADHATAETEQKADRPLVTKKFSGQKPFRTGTGNKVHKQSGSWMVKVISVITAAAAASVVAIVTIAANRKPVVNLSNYIIIEFEGNDGSGTVSPGFDYAGFSKDFGDLKADPDVIKELSDRDEEDADLEELRKEFVSELTIPDYYSLYYADPSIEPSAGLSNGDTVTCSWDLSEDDLDRMGKVFHCKIRTPDITKKVNGLPEQDVDERKDSDDTVFNIGDSEQKDGSEESSSQVADTQGNGNNMVNHTGEERSGSCDEEVPSEKMDTTESLSDPVDTSSSKSGTIESSAFLAQDNTTEIKAANKAVVRQLMYGYSFRTVDYLQTLNGLLTSRYPKYKDEYYTSDDPDSISENSNESYSYKYDSNGNILSKKIVITGTGETESTTYYTYDSYGNELSEETDGAVTSVEYTYDGDRVTSLTPTDENRDYWYSLTFKYDDSGRIISYSDENGGMPEMSFDYSGNAIVDVYMSVNGEKRLIWEFGSDSEGKIISAVFHGEYGEDDETETFTFSYNDDGTLAGYTKTVKSSYSQYEETFDDYFEY